MVRGRAPGRPPARGAALGASRHGPPKAPCQGGRRVPEDRWAPFRARKAATPRLAPLFVPRAAFTRRSVSGPLDACHHSTPRSPHRCALPSRRSDADGAE
ncbi:hypothetical protein E2C01_003375 [Portunus trituberculatus]|uniref:Uncharacterized protein n=1 Tax=Portunus trituberculatus TaxID=210409 RepID=A0A5B7CNJ4_PORTR|nr:hypothetical protein [Portunus trituberculatus]